MAQGAAYVFVTNGNTWSQQAELTASDGSAFDDLGYSVSLNGTAAVVGSPFHQVGSDRQGAAYVFLQSGNNWTQQAELTASDGAGGDNLGRSVALDGSSGTDVYVAGAPYHTISPNQFQGEAYVFVPSLPLSCASGTAQVGVPYTSALVASGGTPPYTYSITSGSLPPGLSLNTSTGAITGTPTTAGTYNYTAQAIDSTGAIGNSSCGITVAPPALTLTCASASAQVGVVYSSAMGIIWRMMLIGFPIQLSSRCLASTVWSWRRRARDIGYGVNGAGGPGADRQLGGLRW